MTRLLLRLLVLSVLLAAPGEIAAQPLEGAFGPQIKIEAIEIIGNTATDSLVIQSVLPIRPGDSLRAGDPKLLAARYRILALGFFRTVQLSLAKGSERGQVVLLIEVEERGTIAVNRMYFGTSLSTPWWIGLDIAERNFLGTGAVVGVAAVATGEGRINGSRAQQSAVLRASDSTLFGTRFGWQASLYGINASEPYQTQGAASDGSNANFQAFDYRRLGLRLGSSLRVGPISSMDFGLRIESIVASLPNAPIRQFPGGETRPIDLYLQDGDSAVASIFASYDRDSRSDPVLPWQGSRFLLRAEVAQPVLGDYNFVSMRAKYQRWFPLRGRKHVLSAHLSGGIVGGNVPFFERIHVGDINRMVPGRALGLITSTTPSLDLLGTSTDEIRYGEVAGLAEVQYSYKLFDSKRFVYGGEFFAGVGLWTLARTGDVATRDSLPIDVLLDFGLRIDTEIGIFELTMANALGRLPL